MAAVDEADRDEGNDGNDDNEGDNVLIPIGGLKRFINGQQEMELNVARGLMGMADVLAEDAFADLLRAEARKLTTLAAECEDALRKTGSCPLTTPYWSVCG